MKSSIRSIHYPISIDSGVGEIKTEHNYPEHIRQLIMQVLLTNMGERINRPDFGCGLRRMIFTPNSIVSANLIQITVSQALEKWLGSVITLNNVNVKAVNETLIVNIEYTIKVNNEKDHLNLDIVL